MKIYHHIISLLALGTVLASCQKYVDIKKSSAQSFLETAEDCRLLMDNYSLFNVDYPFDGEVSADDYYVDNTYYNSSLISVEDRTVYTWNANAIRIAALQWVKTYNRIYHANLVLETIDGLGVKEEAVVLNDLKGAALFLRAYSLWHVAQLYAAPYSNANLQQPGVPVHLKSDINDLPGRGTIAQTYDRIVKDLKDAATLLNETSSIASRPDKAAAYAMLARVYLSMQDYPNASLSATEALKLQNSLIDFNTLSTGTLTPFKRFNNEVIFHAVRTRIDILDPGYGDGNKAVIDSVLVASYEANDLRKSIFFKENFDEDMMVPQGTFRFTGNYEQTVSSAQFTGLAVDEIYLTRAECYARANDVTNAMKDLNTLLRTRWRTGTYVDKTAASADQALTMILSERRKELVMRSLRWTDLRRLNMDARFKRDIYRKITTNNVPATFTLKAEDARYILLIPQEVITNSSLPQNVR